MKHAGARSLDRISGLLASLRALELLKEKRPGVFYLRSKAFVHFHDDGDDVFADVRALGDTEFARLEVTSTSGQRTLLQIARASCRAAH